MGGGAEWQRPSPTELTDPGCLPAFLVSVLLPAWAVLSTTGEMWGCPSMPNRVNLECPGWRHSEQCTGSLHRRPAHSRRPPPPTDPLSQLRPAGPASPKDRATPSGPQQPKPRHSPVLPLLPGEPRPHKVTPHRTWPTPRGEEHLLPVSLGSPAQILRNQLPR